MPEPVKQNGQALQFASRQWSSRQLGARGASAERLRDRSVFVPEAVKQNDRTRQLASRQRSSIQLALELHLRSGHATGQSSGRRLLSRMVGRVSLLPGNGQAE
eukprot:14401314-Heterocapsa_arctica.AAC.1